ncbi:MAG TPA: hypothetical protein VKA19_11455 [Alphaproteobacteria bacterium]|nr:hypothetical protein [Alphaproteobacteria bacterium]
MTIFPQGGVNASIFAWLYQDNSGSNPGEAATGLTSASTGIGLGYIRPGGTLQTVTLSDLGTVDAAHSDGGMIAVDATNAPGLYRFDLPDAAIAAGENACTAVVIASGVVTRVVELILDPNPSIVQGAIVSDAGNTASTFKTDLSETTDDQYVDAFVLFRTGANAGAVRHVSAYNGTTKFLTVDTAFPTAPSSSDEFVLVNR